jgi:hypothetical protein
MSALAEQTRLNTIGKNGGSEPRSWRPPLPCPPHNILATNATVPLRFNSEAGMVRETGF